MQCFEHLGRAEELDLDSLDGVDSSELGLAAAVGKALPSSFDVSLSATL